MLIELSIQCDTDQKDMLIRRLLEALDGFAEPKPDPNEPLPDQFDLVPVEEEDQHRGTIGIVCAVNSYRDFSPLIHDRLFKVTTQLAEEAELHRLDGSLVDRVRGICRIYEDRANNTIVNTKEFLDQTMIYLRAIQLCAGMVLEASTHGDKNARARGLIDIIENSVQQVGEFIGDFTWKNFRRGSMFDPWRKDPKVSRLLDTIREQRDTIDKLKADTVKRK